MGLLSNFAQATFDSEAYKRMLEENSRQMEYGTSYSQGIDASTYGDVGILAALGAGFLIFSLIVIVAVYVVTALFLSKIFTKAGVEGWKAWVPILNGWTLLEMGGQKGFWAILSIIPVVNIVSAVFMVIAMYHVGRNFGKEDWFVVLAILVPIVWIIWLAVDKSTWNGPRPAVASATPAQPPTQPPAAA